MLLRRPVQRQHVATLIEANGPAEALRGHECERHAAESTENPDPGQLEQLKSLNSFTAVFTSATYS